MKKRLAKHFLNWSSSLGSVIMLMIIIVTVNQFMTGVDLVEGCRSTHSPPLQNDLQLSKISRKQTRKAEHCIVCYVFFSGSHNLTASF